MSHHSTHSKKRTFILKNVDLNATNLKYGLAIISNIEKEKDLPNKTTKITDVLTELEHPMSFLDENKKNYNTLVTMMDWSRQKALPEQTTMSCYWCRHPFSTKPIGCPIRYVNSLIEKNYVSHITKDKYYMKENITPSKLNALTQYDDSNIQITPIHQDYYLVDGIFCSFNCALSFIKENNHNLFYKESYSLLSYLYYSFMGKREKILPAPHWRLLKDYGGELTIEEFRKSFYNVDYEFMFNVRELKDMRPVSKVYREKSLS